MPEFSKYSKMVSTEHFFQRHQAQPQCACGLEPSEQPRAVPWALLFWLPRGWEAPLPRPPLSPVTRCGDSALHLSADAPNAVALQRRCPRPLTQAHGAGPGAAHDLTDGSRAGEKRDVSDWGAISHRRLCTPIFFLSVPRGFVASRSVSGALCNTWAPALSTRNTHTTGPASRGEGTWLEAGLRASERKPGRELDAAAGAWQGRRWWLLLVGLQRS